MAKINEDRLRSIAQKHARKALRNMKAQAPQESSEEVQKILDELNVLGGVLMKAQVLSYKVDKLLNNMVKGADANFIERLNKVGMVYSMHNEESWTTTRVAKAIENHIELTDKLKDVV